MYFFSKTIFPSLVIALVFLTVLFRYYDYVIAQNFQINVFSECKPETESCFIANEKNAWADIQLTPYKKISISRKYAPNCLENHSCDSFRCSSTNTCEETLCSEETIDEGEECTSQDQKIYPENITE